MVFEIVVLETAHALGGLEEMFVAHPEGHLGVAALTNELVDLRAIGLAAAQPLKIESRAQYESRSFFAGHGKQQRPGASRGLPLRFSVGHGGLRNHRLDFARAPECQPFDAPAGNPEGQAFLTVPLLCQDSHGEHPGVPARRESRWQLQSVARASVALAQN